MTTETENSAEKVNEERLERLNQNVVKMDELSKRLVAAMGKKRKADPGLQAPGNDVYLKAAAGYMAEMMSNPSRSLKVR